MQASSSSASSYQVLSKSAASNEGPVDRSSNKSPPSTSTSAFSVIGTNASDAFNKVKSNAMSTLKALQPKKKNGKETALEFPPPHWAAEQAEVQNIIVAGTSTQRSAETTGYNVDGPAVASNQIPAPPSTMKDLPPVPDAPGTAQPEEPATVARRIQLLLVSMPSFYRNTSPPPSDSNPQEPPSVSSAAGPPPTAVPPTAAALTTDPRLISELSSTTIMSGIQSKDQESVWSILDRLRFTPPELFRSKSKGKEKAVDNVAVASEQSVPVEMPVPVVEPYPYTTEYPEDMPPSEIMLCSPLIPSRDSIVELAPSEVMSFEDYQPMASTSSLQAGVQSMMSQPMSLEASISSALQEKLDLSNPAAGTANVSESKEASKPMKQKVVWMPSQTGISVQATWWGYRIYLPPPVLNVLNNKTLEAAKRAAIITTALKWLLDHIPMAAIPPQFKAAAALLKHLVPILGYVGSFIGWSWGAIRSFDKGHGVILTATWILPVVLIPGTWETEELPPAPVST